MSDTSGASDSAGATSGSRVRLFFTILAGVITAIAALLTAVVGAIVALRGGDSEQPSAADDRAPVYTPGGEPTPAVDNVERSHPPEPAPEPEPAGFGAGVWEVGQEIPPATYVTTVPEGDGSDSCYWARLSGFTGDSEQLIANGNIDDAGSRGRIEILASDAGVEFSGECLWVEVSAASSVEAVDEVGEGIWEVGDEVSPGIYTTTVPEGDGSDSCYWARLSGFTGDFDQLIANGNIDDAGSRGRIEILASDAGVEFSGDCTWTRN